MTLSNDLTSLGFQFVSERDDPSGERMELWVRPSLDGPVLINVTYPKKRERK